MSAPSKDEDKNSDEFLPGYKTLEDYTKVGYKTLMEAIRNSNTLPTGSNWDYYSTFDSFNKSVKEDGVNILKLMSNVLSYKKVRGNIVSRTLDEKTELIIDANDILLERVANNIDELNGIQKVVNEPVQIQTVSAKLPAGGAWNRVNKAKFSVKPATEPEIRIADERSVHLLTAKNIIRPQTFFKDVINNSSRTPWEPRIKEKPNSLKPLAIFLEETEKGEEFSHPYEFELEHFNPIPEQLCKEKPCVPLPLETTPLIEVTQPEEIDALVEELRNCKEIAIDLEHHSYRSFMGFTCLMQISTTQTDYIIDTLALRDKLYVLNEVLTKPTIVKIFHGAEQDIQWLQRDLSLYIVNMFDTHEACKTLGFSSASLAHLMKKYCNVLPDKKFQLADWRIRPLPNELKLYARKDTHYLIYIYQMMKNELLRRANGNDNLLRSVINKSTEICKTRYFKPVLKEDSYMNLYRKCKRLFDNRQLCALKGLYDWRDEIARNTDESTGYVLPNHMLLQISENMPREMQGVLACCNPVPPLVRANLLELHKIVLGAREQPVEKPIFKEENRARGVTKKISKIDMDSKLNCPHDLRKYDEFRDDLPTLLGNKSNLIEDIFNTDTSKYEKAEPILSVFSAKFKNSDKWESDTLLKLQSFLGPFERYKLVKPFIQEEEKKLQAQKELEAKEKNTKSNESNSTATDEQSPVDPQIIQQKVENVRQHFLALSKLSEQENQLNLSKTTLVEMGGSKKRKREEWPQEEFSQFATDYSTTIPVYDGNNRNGRKRKWDNNEDERPSKEFRFDKKVQKNKQNTPKKQKQLGGNFVGQNLQHKRHQQGKSVGENSQQGQHLNTGEKGKWTARSKSFKQNRQKQQNTHHQHFTSHGSQEHSQQDQHLNISKAKKLTPTVQSKFSNLKLPNHQETHGQHFTSHNYSAVDFNKFQGGARAAHNPQKFNSNFKSKRKNRNRNRNNKSSNFKGQKNNK